MTDTEVVATAREPAEMAEEVAPEPTLKSALTGELLGGFITILIVGLTVGVLVFTTAPLTMTSLNPARDLGPRLMPWAMGFGKIAFPGLNHGLSTLVTIFGPIAGGVAGALFFDHVLLRRYPGSEREKGLVTEPAQLAEERPEGLRIGHGHVVRG